MPANTVDPVVEPVTPLDDDTLATLFSLVYTGYHVPMHVDGALMRFLCVAGDLDRGASRLLRVDGEAVAVAMLGLRGEDAWIGGMGVAPDWRGRGLGERVMREVIAVARARGARRVGLEVLEPNVHAIRVYERLGFVRTRGLEVWALPAPDFEDDGPALEPVAVEEAQAFVRAHRRAPEPWQRADGTIAALRADSKSFEGLLAKRGARVVGAMVSRIAGRASVVQLATLPEEARPATHALLASLRRDDAPDGVRWLNLPDDDPAAPIVRALGATREAGQHEMSLALA